MAHPRIPLSCYRLQFNGDFTFRGASAALDYLSRLGITDIYSSPLLQSRFGSKHGYDVTDPLRIDSELGNEAQFDAFQSMFVGTLMPPISIRPGTGLSLNPSIESRERSI